MTCSGPSLKFILAKIARWDSTLICQVLILIVQRYILANGTHGYLGMIKSRFPVFSPGLYMEKANCTQEETLLPLLGKVNKCMAAHLAPEGLLQG